MQRLSRPIRKTSTGKGIEVYSAATKVAAITVTPQMADVYLQLTDGPGGQILWEIEADASSGSHSVSFGSNPLLFPNGIYANVVEDGANALKSFCVAVIVPQSAGT